jgi:hypothetical protein
VPTLFSFKWPENKSLLFTDENGKFGDGDAERCVTFDNIQVQCVTGVCKNISEVYKCDFKVSMLFSL